MISLSLTALLLSFLFALFVYAGQGEKKIEQARREVGERHHLQTTLDTFFLGIESGSTPFYTERFPEEKEASLVALFDHGLDPDPTFSGPLTGRIFLNPRRELTLAYWPLDKEKRQLWREERLLSNVTSFQFDFLAPQQKGPPLYDWTPRWPKELQKIPHFVRLTVWRGQEPLTFAFEIPSGELDGIYPRPGVPPRKEGAAS